MFDVGFEMIDGFWFKKIVFFFEKKILCNVEFCVKFENDFSKFIDLEVDLDLVIKFFFIFFDYLFLYFFFV